MKKETGSILFVLAAATMWGTIGITVRALSAIGFTSVEMVELRLLLAALILGLYLAIFDRDKLRISPKDIGWFLGTGLCSILFFNICYVSAIKVTSLSIAAVLLYCAPIFVTLMSVPVFKEPVTWRKAAAIGCSVLGCALVSGVVGGTGTLSPKGFLFGMGAAFGYALYGVLSRKLIRRYASPTILFGTFVTAGLGGLFLIRVPNIAETVSTQPTAIPLLLISTLAANIIPYLLFTQALKHLEASRASVVASVEPVVATFVGLFVFGEALKPTGILGIALVLGAIWLLNHTPASRSMAATTNPE